MTDLIEKLRLIALRAHKSDVPIIEAAIDRIKWLEDQLSDYEEDITDWQDSVVTQMKRRRDD